jgi:hypothetical protein
MSTSRETIRHWLVCGLDQGHTHCIVVHDEFDGDDYPRYADSGAKAKELVQEYRDGKHSMQRVMEVYSLLLGWERQLNEYRSYHYEDLPAER